MSYETNKTQILPRFGKDEVEEKEVKPKLRQSDLISQSEASNLQKSVMKPLLLKKGLSLKNIVMF